MNAPILTISGRQAALRRSIIRVIPDYYAWPPAEQERYRLNIGKDREFSIRQALLKTLFDIEVGNEEEMDEVLGDFDDEQYLLLNSTLLPFQGIGENDFFLNEYFPEGRTLLDFGTVGDYAEDDHGFQEKTRKENNPAYEIRSYRGDLLCCWARLNIDDQFHYATLCSLAAYLQDISDEKGSERIEALIPHRYVKGKDHGKRGSGGTRYHVRVDADGMEPQLEELQHRFCQYQRERYESLLDRFDGEAKGRVYVRHHPQQGVESHVDFIFSDKEALAAVRFRYFYKDCHRIAGDLAELEALIGREQALTVDFLDREHRDILDNFDPTVGPKASSSSTAMPSSL
jgi:hypothetical protein